MSVDHTSYFRTQAEFLQKSLSGPHAASALLRVRRALHGAREMSDAEIVRDIRHSNCLEVVAREQGFANWKSLEENPTRIGTLAEMGKETFWLVDVTGLVEPEVIGPYPTDDERNDAALKVRRRQDDEEDALFWLDVTDGEPFIGSYSGGFFEDLEADEDDDEPADLRLFLEKAPEDGRLPEGVERILGEPSLPGRMENGEFVYNWAVWEEPSDAEIQAIVSLLGSSLRAIVFDGCVELYSADSE